MNVGIRPPTFPLAYVAGMDGIFVDGDWVESKDQDPNGDVRLIQLADIGIGEYLNKSNRRLTRQTANRLRCTFLQADDILVARMPDPIGRACIFPGDQSPCVTVVDVCVVRPASEIANPLYLLHILNSLEFQARLTGLIKGATRQRISRRNLQQVHIPIPTLDEQRRIAAILDQADDLRRKRREALDKIGQLGQSILAELLNSQEYHTRPLRDVCRRITDGTHQAPEWAESGVPFIFVSNVRNQRISLQTTRCVSEATYAELTRRSPIELGDVLYTAVGSYGNAARITTTNRFIF